MTFFIITIITFRYFFFFPSLNVVIFFQNTLWMTRGFFFIILLPNRTTFTVHVSKGVVSVCHVEVDR